MSNESRIKSASYDPNGSNSVQGSWKYASHQTLSVGAVSVASATLANGLVLISLTDYTYVAINGTATTSSMLFPPGMVALMVDKGDTLNFLQVSAASKACIIVPE